MTYCCTRCGVVIETAPIERLPSHERPSWTPIAKEDTMIVYASVLDRLTGECIDGDGALMAAFDREGECRGVAEIMDGPRGRLFQLSIGVEISSESGIVLKVWDPATGETTEIPETIACNGEKQIGTIFEPFVFEVGMLEQTISLGTGWSWVASGLVLDDARVGAVFAGCEFADGDVVKTANKSTTYYGGAWYPADFEIRPGVAYVVKKSAGGAEEVVLSGLPMEDAIAVTFGWNWIGGASLEAFAISGLSHSVGFEDHDVVKSSSASATYWGGDWWPGAFTIQPGVGYKAKLANAGVVSCQGVRSETPAKSGRRAMLMSAGARAAAPEWTPVKQDETFIASLQVTNSEGVAFSANGSRIAAFAADGECRGVSEIMVGPEGRLFQLSIGIASDSETGFTLKLWDAETGEMHDVSEKLDANRESIGAIEAPVVLSVVDDAEVYVAVADATVVAGEDGGYSVVADDGKVLEIADFSFSSMVGDEVVDTKDGYDIAIAADGRSATVRLKLPAIGVAVGPGEAAPEKAKDDGTGLLVDIGSIGEGAIMAKPDVGEGETLGALPVAAVRGLWYQAEWGGSIDGMTPGAKVQADGGALYLGVIKQKGDRGFYKVTVSEH